METGLIVHSAEPLNAEPPLQNLVRSFTTARQDFYVRSHGSIPRLDAATHRLRVDGLVDRVLDLSLADLQARFPQHTIQAVVQCAGNRRADLAAVAPVSGDLWEGGAIGNAEWTGIALADVLRAAGATGRHIALHGADDCVAGDSSFRFGVSIAAEKAMHPDTILAWAMNGAPLAPEHGYPLRAIVPGFAGVRSTKWLERIELRDRPWDGAYQAHEYRLFPSDIAPECADYDAATVIEAMPLNAAICDPANDATLPAGPAALRGWAVACGRAIARVEVSADDGRHWCRATLQHGEGPWAWTLWQATLHLQPGRYTLAVRAWDDAGQTMPSSAADVWNFKGYLSAAWHRVPVTVVD